MNKGDFVAAVADAAELSKTDAANAVDAMVSVITKTLKKGDTVTLTGFGAFGVRKRGARMGRNPQTGESIKVAASKVPGFKAGASLKATVSGKSKAAAAKRAGKTAAKGTAKRGR